MSEDLHAALVTARAERDAALVEVCSFYARVADLTNSASRAEYKELQAWEEVKTLLAKERELRSALEVVKTGIDDVWFWQDDGYDHPKSLSCPVVMHAETVREFVADREALKLLMEAFAQVNVR